MDLLFFSMYFATIDLSFSYSACLWALLCRFSMIIVSWLILWFSTLTIFASLLTSLLSFFRGRIILRILSFWVVADASVTHASFYFFLTCYNTLRFGKRGDDRAVAVDFYALTDSIISRSEAYSSALDSAIGPTPVRLISSLFAVRFLLLEAL